MNKILGFTLIELLVTLSILGILSTLAFPSFGNLLEKEKATANAYNLYHHLQYARSISIIKNKTITICASVDISNCSKSQDWSNKSIMVFEDNNNNGKHEYTEEVLKVLNINLENSSLIWRSFGNKNYLQWQSNGMTYYQNGNFTYCPASKNLRNAKKIIMNAAGRVYFGADKNKDGIPEGADGKNANCDTDIPKIATL